MVRVVFIITGLSTGGAETMLYRVLERIDRREFSPHVISLTQTGDVGRRIEALQIPVEALSMKANAFGFAAFTKLVLRLRALKPAVVHTWMYHSDLLGGLAARLVGIRAVAWALHNSNLDPDKSKRSTRMVMRLCALLSGRIPLRILSCSTRARAIHVAAGYDSTRMAVIPNGFDLERFHPDAEARLSVRKELGIAPDVFLVGLIARYDRQKNHAGFIEAAKLVHQNMPEVHFVLAGSGIDLRSPELRELIENAGLQRTAHLLGERDDIPRLMASLDVLASSSYSEAFPNVLGEAMACGVTCVVTDAGDSADIVGETGRVVAVGDMAALARELSLVLRLSAAERRDLAMMARERVRERYEIGHVVGQYEAFYTCLSQVGEVCAV